MDLQQTIDPQPRSKTGSRGGLTLTELIVASAIAAAVGLAFMGILRSMVKSELRMKDLAAAQDEGLRFLVQFEMDLKEANQFVAAEDHAVQVRVGSERMPGWDPEADPDGDGLSNLEDGDDDGDLETLPAPGEWWRVGNDRDDDDDDNDGEVDLEVLYERDGDRIYRTAIVNGRTQTRQQVAKGVVDLTFTYWGSIKRTGASLLDTDGDSRISAGEIDGTPPPNGPGDGNGALDTEAELSWVADVEVKARLDSNGDGRSDREIEIGIAPPLAFVKARAP